MTPRVSGFTLLEVIIVTMMIGVMASLAFVHYGTVMEKMRAKEGEGLLYAALAELQRDMVENSPPPGVPSAWTESIGQSSEHFHQNVAMVRNISALNKCNAVAVFRRGNGRVSIPNACGIGAMGTAGSSMYALSASISYPSGTPSFICTDSGNGICNKLGYSYNQLVTQEWPGAQIQIN